MNNDKPKKPDILPYILFPYIEDGKEKIGKEKQKIKIHKKPKDLNAIKRSDI